MTFLTSSGDSMEYDVKGTVLRKLEMRWTEKKMADV
jgi:hypothetical protein